MTGRILLVEADVVLGAVVVEVLRHSRYEVSFVRTLRDEVERVRSQPVSAVILDLDMISGEKELAYLGLLRSSLESLPIVLMGLQAPEDLHQRLRVHLGRLRTKHLAWVKKPFRNEELLAALRQVHGSSPIGSAFPGERNIGDKFSPNT